MAMTKAEQAKMAALEQEVALARALSWPSYREPQKVLPPGPGTRTKTYTSGWACFPTRAWGGDGPDRAVAEAWSTSMSHGYGSSVPTVEGGSRDPIPVYRAKVDALMALRIEVTKKAAETLAAIDAAIDAADKE